ncbi:MAG: hypothetical protein ACRC35_01860 [Angustibacter sp.]
MNAEGGPAGPTGATRADPSPAARSTIGAKAASGSAAPAAGKARWSTVRVRDLPDAVLVLAWYVVTRVWGALLIDRAAGEQLPSVWTGSRSGYSAMAQLWDGQWYKIIAEQGYPLPLPTDGSGVVQQNAWAFFPGFPYATKVVMLVTGWPFAATAVVLNLLLGGCAVVVVTRVVRRLAGRRAALGGAVLLCAVPSAPALQIAYSESLALLLLALATDALLRRRYGWCAVAVLALALTRPVVAPFAVVVLAHLLARYRAHHGVLGWGDLGREPFSRVDQLRVVSLGLFTAASSVLWPVSVGVLVGSADAYERTQAAWRTGGVVRPFQQAVGIAQLLWGPGGGYWLLAGAIALLVLLASRWGRSIGPEMAAWSLSYPFYLLAVTEPWTSTFRYLLLMFPLFAVLARVLRWPVLIVAVAGIGLWGQAVWVHELLLFTPPTDYPP